MLALLAFSAPPESICSACRQTLYEPLLSARCHFPLMLRLLRHPDAPALWFFFAITAAIVSHIGR